MKHIVLYAAALANGGGYLDAGTEVEVGDGEDQINAAAAQSLVDQGRGASRTADAANNSTAGAAGGDALDHDGDGLKGGSLPGEQSTASKGRRRREAASA